MTINTERKEWINHKKVSGHRISKTVETMGPAFRLQTHIPTFPPARSVTLSNILTSLYFLDSLVKWGLVRNNNNRAEPTQNGISNAVYLIINKLRNK